MKKIGLIVIVILVMLLVSCSPDPGPEPRPQTISIVVQKMWNFVISSTNFCKYANRFAFFYKWVYNHIWFLCKNQRGHKRKETSAQCSFFYDWFRGMQDKCYFMQDA